MEGWVKLHRNILEWRWITSSNHLAVFTTLLLRATHKESEWRDIKLAPGQLITGRKQLSSWTGLSEMQIRTILRDLVTSGEINQQTTSKFSIISINNWSKYQDDNQQITSKQPASNQQVTTFKNAKNVKNNNTSENFTEEFFDGVIDDPKKILPKVKTQRKQKGVLEKSPLAFLFKPDDEIQSWLISPGSSLNVQNELLENYSHHVLAEEVKTAFQWQIERTERNAGLFLKNWLKNKPKKKIYGDSDPLDFLAEQHGIIVQSEEESA